MCFQQASGKPETTPIPVMSSVSKSTAVTDAVNRQQAKASSATGLLQTILGGAYKRRQQAAGSAPGTTIGG